MLVSSIDNKTFGSKKFRLVSTLVDCNREVSSTGNFRNCCKYVQEYSNPKAKDLYEQAQNTSDIMEKVRLYDEMGYYEIKRLNIKERLKEFYNSFVSRYVFK